MVCITYSWCNYIAKEIFGILSAFFLPKRLLALFPQGATGLTAGRPRTQNVPRRTNHLWIYRTRRLWFQRSTRSWCWRSSASSRPTRPPWKTQEKQVCPSAEPVITSTEVLSPYLLVSYLFEEGWTLPPLPHTRLNSFAGADESQWACSDFWPSVVLVIPLLLLPWFLLFHLLFQPPSLYWPTNPFVKRHKKASGYFNHWHCFIFLYT